MNWLKKKIFQVFIQDYIFIEWRMKSEYKNPEATIRIGKKWATISGRYSPEKDRFIWTESFSPKSLKP